VTVCGNFAVLGYANGAVSRFNIQSGMQRLTYGRPGLCSFVRSFCSLVYVP
jgi:hypothetical protein